jgi:cobalt-zinc-cadmium efflux system outer membrane protein
MFTTTRLQSTVFMAALLMFPDVARSQARAQPITLEEAIQATTSNPSVGAARERVRAAQGALRTARAWTNPTFTYQVEKAPLPGAKSIALEREQSLFAMLPLAPLYQLGPRAARARFEVAGAESELHDAQRMTTLAAASSFFRAATAQIGVRSAEDVGRWLDSLVVYTTNRVSEGAAAEVDLLRLQVERGRADVDLAMSRMELARELAELSALTGVEADSVRIDFSSFIDSTRVRGSLDSVIAIALTRRPDLAGADARVSAAASGVTSERRAVLRDLDAMAGVMKMEEGRSVMAGVSIPFPLFDRNAGGIQRARAELKAAEFDRELTRRRIISDIRSAFAATKSLQSALLKTSTLVSKAEESRRISEAAYREGAIPLNQVIDASRALAEARESYAMAYFGWRQSLFELTSSTSIRLKGDTQ